MIGHKIGLNKFKKTETISNIFLDHTRNQKQEENWKSHKYVEPKQYATEWPKGQWRNQMWNKNLPWNKQNENMTHEHLWNAAKGFLRGKLIEINAYLKKEELSKINNLWR